MEVRNCLCSNDSHAVRACDYAVATVGASGCAGGARLGEPRTELPVTRARLHPRCGVLSINLLFGTRIRRGWQFAGLIAVGLVFSYVMPIAARAGIFGSALQRKTVDQDGFNVPLLLAGRTEPPMTISAILERPLLGWGSAMHLTPDVYTQAEHLAIRMGFSPTFPFELLWRLPATDYSATHSILLGSWAEGGVLAALLPVSLLLVCLGLVWDFPRLGRWAPLGATIALQGVWDLMYGPWQYNMIPTFACIVLFFSATPLSRVATLTRRSGDDSERERGDRHDRSAVLARRAVGHRSDVPRGRDHRRSGGGRADVLPARRPDRRVDQ